MSTNIFGAQVELKESSSFIGRVQAKDFSRQKELEQSVKENNEFRRDFWRSSVVNRELASTFLPSARFCQRVIRPKYNSMAECWHVASYEVVPCGGSSYIAEKAMKYTKISVICRD
ncbi:hypothetical protein PHYBLDRAFT_68709 [Phycomyces blakesleeanus NRRL 1555(-)]|uniref:Uncharacterized protein n=1 Tax=Phycomyces blakesleeanus (strain ATCC 8743b / DSM 1359 / FGSC 10004 / NBRC 33097 / NRRL 1555) TaxID=763407 RepID=A0A167M795_PHYB8|nr:hypothetical protein PHYBLDRAFT_68709 [Phycomyces blakesleeanus NRRL 1555(-)]OAD72014.1 hypothetical protein PHYBLDRAFT_68709 [Phycomyces blakesleeanus NRRL 1555(-)]|eukprot:XP_018290054.1 hypothetical protein PHYBLDRAFT_68709 [Phycomyces blakesleeanus NRRL 1555(-)]